MSGCFRIAAPAKLNLGLEIVGKRADGYHDLVTILQTIAPPDDDLELAAATDVRLRIDDPELGGPDNLALQALHRLRTDARITTGAALRLTKRIPIAAGLGGASSDAASALLAARALWNLDTPDARLAAIAGRLGSDVPFFLIGGAALAEGRGTELTPLPSPPVVFVVVAPHATIPRKTPTLYAALDSADYSSGAAVREQAARLCAGNSLDPTLLVNAFARPLYALRPDLAEIPAIMRRAGAMHPAISGAGPAHVAPFIDPERAKWVATTLRAAVGHVARIFVAHPAPGAQPRRIR